MKRLIFFTTIQASRQKTWDTLWSKETYGKWTGVFSAGSHMITTMKEGDKVLFLSGSGEGMVSRIGKIIPNEYLSFEHLGMVKNGVEDTTSEEVKSWKGAQENYILKGTDGITTLLVEMDTAEDMEQYFKETWPKALDLLKSLAEGKLATAKITPFLWFNNNLEEALGFYTSIFGESDVLSVTNINSEGGKMMSATFRLNGQEFMALDGGPMFSFTPAISFFIHCDTQDEVDRLWEQLSAGGEQQQCGWLKDKFGLSWQVVPKILEQLMHDKDPAKSKRVMDAMLKMGKLDIAQLQAAHDYQ